MKLAIAVLRDRLGYQGVSLGVVALVWSTSNPAYDLSRYPVTAIDWLAERRLAHPGMHVYHYNHTERTALQSLTREHGVAEVAECARPHVDDHAVDLGVLGQVGQ